MRYGTVQIITGSDIGINMFRRISNPVRFKREMLNAKEALKTTSELAAQTTTTDTVVPAAESAPSGSGKPASHIPDLIAELDELRKRDIISKEEFEAKKKELLDRL
jgi:hypothetical protein